MKIMKYETFAKLYMEARCMYGKDDLEMYIAERGWQDWMDWYDENQIAKLLREIYKMAHMDIKSIRANMNKTRAEFSREYFIPLRTLQNWELGPESKEKREPATHEMIALVYTFFIYDIYIKETGNE